jgi:hypothetical protein
VLHSEVQALITISSGPVGAEQLGLFEDGVSRLLLLVGRVAVFAENALDCDADFGADGFALGPVDGDVVANGSHQLLSDGLKCGLAQHLDSAVVDLKGLVKGGLVLGEPEVVTAFAGFVRLS